MPRPGRTLTRPGPLQPRVSRRADPHSLRRPLIEVTMDVAARLVLVWTKSPRDTRPHCTPSHPEWMDDRRGPGKDDLVTQINALVADLDFGTGDDRSDFVLRLSAEGTPTRGRFLSHSFSRPVARLIPVRCSLRRSHAVTDG
jgi:hypothetical protein